MGREYDAGVLGRCIVVIPALSPDPKVTDYVSALLGKGFRQVVVVDDGSGDAFAGTFYALEQTAGCTVLHHEKNRGKGRALKTAFAHILNCPLWEGSAVVTADADGQHSVEGVCAVAARRCGSRGETPGHGCAGPEPAQCAYPVQDRESGHQLGVPPSLWRAAGGHPNRAAGHPLGPSALVCGDRGRSLRVRDEYAHQGGPGACGTAAGVY